MADDYQDDDDDDGSDRGGGAEMSSPSGYRGAAAEMLDMAGATAGDTVSITSRDGTAHTGVLMPRYEYDDDTHIVIKLGSGYNVGIDTESIRGVAVAARPPAAGPGGGAGAKVGRAIQDSGGREPAGKRMLLLSTGGTIASRIDYRTGAVTPVLSAGDLLGAIPELGSIATMDTEVVISEYSENITPEHWLMTARRIAELAGGQEGKVSGGGSGGYAGVIVAHGTDTMHYTSAFLSFALAGFPIPIVLVGAQRSPDRASSDAATNLIGAARLISACHEGGINGVYVAMHNGTGDDAIACHAGTRVRKNHTSRRDAFQTIGGEPAFVISEDGTVKASTSTTTSDSAASASASASSQSPPSFYGKPYNPTISLDRRVALVKYHPGYDPELLGHIIDSGYRAVIFEGTGLGHVGRTAYGQVERASERGMFLGMTSQCIAGRTAMTVYESGRDLMKMGITPLGDMIPEVALVKAMWAASQADDAAGIRQIMLKNVASEMTA